jgi:stringent starvation protein B
MPLNLDIVREAVVKEMLTRGCAFLHVDTGTHGCDVPESLRGGAVVFRFGYGLTPPILDLSINSDGISGTLKFRGVYYRCVIPWGAVRAVIDEDKAGLIFIDDKVAPDDKPNNPSVPIVPSREKPCLRVVRDDDAV